MDSCTADVIRSCQLAATSEIAKSSPGQTCVSISVSIRTVPIYLSQLEQGYLVENLISALEVIFNIMRYINSRFTYIYLARFSALAVLTCV